MENATPRRTVIELVAIPTAPEVLEPDEPAVTLAVLVGVRVAKAPSPERTGLPMLSCIRFECH